jgi:hypothetical protein
MLFKALVPTSIPTVTLVLSGFLPKTSLRILSRPLSRTRVLTASPTWGSKSKKDKRKVPLRLTIDMSLSPEQEALLAPLRARVKEQVPPCLSFDANRLALTKFEVYLFSVMQIFL